MQRAQGNLQIAASRGRAVHQLPRVSVDRNFEKHPLSVLDRAFNEAGLDGFVPSLGFDRYLRQRGISSIAWLRSALLQVLYGVNDDARWVEELQFNMLYRWFVGLDPHRAYCWKASEHARAWLRLHSHPHLLAAFRELLVRARAVIPHSLPAAKRDLASLEMRKQINKGDKRESKTRGRAGSAIIANRDERRFDRALKLIRSRISDVSLTPDDIAAALNVSRRTLYYVFRERGLSPYEIIRKERLEYCKRALTDPARWNTKIITIAMDAGFKDVSTFCRQFKSRYGVSPSAVRCTANSDVVMRRSLRSCELPFQ